MRNEVVEAHIHFPPISRAEPLAVPVDLQVEANTAVLPRIAELFGRHRKGRHRTCRLGLNPAETRFHFDRRNGTQRPVVDLHDQLDVLHRFGGIGAHRNVVDDHPVLAFEVDPVFHARERHVIDRAVEAIGKTLIHQRFLGFDRIETEGDLHQFAMRRKRRSVEPLPAAWQWGGAIAGIETIPFALFQPVGEFRKPRHECIPPLDRSEQIGGSVPDLEIAAPIGGYDDQAAIAGL